MRYDGRIGLALPHHGEAKRRQIDVLLANLEGGASVNGSIAHRPGDPPEGQGIEAGAQVPHASCRSSSTTPAFTLAPSAYAGPTQLGQPSAQGQPARCPAARC